MSATSTYFLVKHCYVLSNLDEKIIPYKQTIECLHAVSKSDSLRFGSGRHSF